ncbi:MAG: Glycyl-glycine endopeptidase [Candidatus Saccharibacteria bacterium]|nr:Glycyl-glycine endopeptidase [Candidatus Saccharibacteria bacterium]
MATKYDVDEKQAADDRYSPESLRAREQNSDEFDSIADNYDQTADDSQENENISKAKSKKDPNKNIDDAKDAEENGSWANKVSGRGVYGNKPMERGERLTPANITALLKRKGPLGLIFAIFAGGTLTLGGLFTGALAPFAFVENVTDDLNDQLAAMDIRNDVMLRTKAPKAQVKETIAGCTKLSIRCKFKTMSRKQVLKYERAGITVKGTGSGVLGTRIAPTEFTFRGGQPMDAKQFSSALNTNQQLRIAHKRAINMKYLGLNDNSFVNRTLKKLGISKRPPELKGTHEERVNKLMNKAQTTKIGDVRFIEVRNADNEVVSNQWTLEGDTGTPKTIYTDAQKTRLAADVTKAATAKPPSRLGTNVMKGLSVLGYWDLACSIKNMIGGASVAAKLAAQYQLAQYIMPVISLVSKAKAEGVSVEDGQVMGEFFAQTDSRKEIVDVEKSVTTDPESGKISPNPVTATKPNPDYGKNVMDSPLYIMSSSKTYNQTSSTESQYSLGMGRNALLAGFSQVSAILETIGDVTGCEFVQNWAVRGVGLLVGVVGAIFSGGATLGAQFAIGGSLIVASMILEAIIHNALSGSVLAEDMDEAPMERGAAGWTGIASILGTSAQTRGMIPANAAQIQEYQALQMASRNDYIAVEKQDANPFDITNQYSFLGAFSRSILPYVSGSTNAQTTFGNVMSFTKNSLSKAITPLSSYAAPIDQSRFKKCDDEGYHNTDIGLNIDADVQCNIRYIMPAEDLKMDTDAVALYMETNKYVEPDTTTGLPPGYTPPEPRASQGFAMDMLNSTVNTFYNTREYGSEYGKFLDYCAYRIMPFGETFEENGQINGVDKRWINGTKCMDTNDPMISNFRIYTLDKTVSEAADEDTIVVPTSSTTPVVAGPGGNSGNVNPNGWTFPTTAGATLNSPFGPRPLGFHTGIDLAVPSGSPFYATRDGTVTTREVDITTFNGGNWCPVAPSESKIQKDIFMTHNVDGVEYTSVYAHLSRFVKKTGDVVKAGDLIGYTGGSGCSTGPHVHFEIWQGKALPGVQAPGMLDPWPLINK